MWFLILLAILVVSVIAKLWSDSAAQTGIRAYLSSLEGFSPTQTLVGSEGRSALAIDENRSLFCLATRANGHFVNRLVAYDQIVGCEVIDDRVSVLKTNRGSQIGGALIGGALLGGAGALVGALSGSKTQVGKSRLIRFVLRLNATSNAVHSVDVMSSKSPISRDAAMYTSAMGQAQTWNHICQVAIKRGGRPDRQFSSSAPISKTLLSSKQVKMRTAVQSMTDFVAADTIISADASMAIAVDQDEKCFAIATREGNKLSLVRCPGGAIRSANVETLMDENNGTLTGIQLRLLINHPERPSYILVMLRDAKGVKGDSDSYKKLVANLTSWKTRLEAGIPASINVGSSHASAPALISPSVSVPKSAGRIFRPEEISVADEIRKLMKLKDEGILTDHEFQIQKLKILDKT